MPCISLFDKFVKKGETLMFWENFCALCRAAGKTPSEVVRQLNIAAGSVTKWKHGTMPGRRSLDKLAEYFSVEPETLFSARMSIRIPVCGDVAAGGPIEALTDVEDYEEIPASMAATGEYVALRIHGDSMQPRMMAGDVVIVRVQPTAENGDIVVVLLDEHGEARATCKKFSRDADGVTLSSFNPDYAPIHLSNEQLKKTPLRMFGRVVELRAKFDN
jgi:repressor LexA